MCVCVCYLALASPRLRPLASAGGSLCVVPQSLLTILPADLRVAFAEPAVPLSLATGRHGRAASPDLLEGGGGRN